MPRITSVVFSLLIFFITACSTTLSAPRPAEWAQPVSTTAVKNMYQLDRKLYRSAQPDAAGFAEIKRLGITTVLNLRDFHTDDAAAKGQGLILQRVAMDAGSITIPQLVAALRIIQAADGPVLIHCRYGSDRAGTVSALYRIIYQGWSREAAIDELVNGGFGYHSIFMNIPVLLRQADLAAIKAALLADDNLLHFYED